MAKLNYWEGQTENTEIEYEISICDKEALEISSIDMPIAKTLKEYDTPDRIDYIVAASCGIFTGLFDSIWVGEFSLEKAQDWGRNRINNFVVKIAQKRGYTKSGLGGAVRFLEKDAPLASDNLTDVWGGGLQHHLRDFAHHASVVGLVFSVLTQFTGMSYGTNTEGLFEIHEIKDQTLIGRNFEEKLFNGVVLWSLHLVSDMAGSSNNPGKGTGIPGPILSMFKELSVLPGIRNLHVNYKGDDISLSRMLSKIFNGTAFEHTSMEELKRFDLRTEIGIYAYGIKQSIPIMINHCVIRAFYFVRRFCIEINSKNIKKIGDIKLLNPQHFLPWDNKCIRRMLTISSGMFCVLDASDAVIRASISSNKKSNFIANVLLRTNFVGIGNFIFSVGSDFLAKKHDNNVIGTTLEKNIELCSASFESQEGTSPSSVTNGFQYEELERWLDRILSANVPLSSESNVYFQINFEEGEQCKLKFLEASCVDKTGIPQDAISPYIDDDLIWNQCSTLQDEDKVKDQVYAGLVHYFFKGKYSSAFIKYKSASVGWNGNFKRIYTRKN